MSDGSLSLANCHREIEELHDFFVAWYTGECSPEDFDRMDDVIGPGFEMVSPEGERMDREAVLEMVREGQNKHDTGAFDIDIRNVDVLHSGDDHALVRYEEWQTSPDGDDARVSTVLFRPEETAPNGLAWVTVHETWLDDGD